MTKQANTPFFCKKNSRIMFLLKQCSRITLSCKSLKKICGCCPDLNIPCSQYHLWSKELLPSDMTSHDLAAFHGISCWRSLIFRPIYARYSFGISTIILWVFRFWYFQSMSEKQRLAPEETKCRCNLLQCSFAKCSDRWWIPWSLKESPGNQWILWIYTSEISPEW